MHHGIYRMAGSPPSWRQCLLAAILVVGPGAVASHRAAARLWELDGFADNVVEVSVGRMRMARHGSPRVHRSTDLHLSVATTRFGIPVSSPARTVHDLGAVVRPGVVGQS